MFESCKCTGTITGQLLVQKRDGRFAGIATVRLDGADADIQIYFDFSPGRAAQAFRDLESLGWPKGEYNFTRFDPETPGHIKVVGQKVTVSKVVKEDGKIYWNYRPRRKVDRQAVLEAVEALKRQLSGQDHRASL